MRLRNRLIGGALSLATVLSPLSAWASSHREAPFITKNPKVDGTDFYAFNSYESSRSGFVTLIANYVPLQDAYGGPNYFGLDPSAIYEIHIDNDGDAKEDLTFQFDFDSVLGNAGAGVALDVGPAGATKAVSVPFVAVGQISAGNEAARTVIDTYKVNLIRGLRRTGQAMPINQTGSTTTTFKKPLDNIGGKTIPNYAAYAAAHIYNIDIPGCTATGSKMFVGQRKEGFAVNLGQIFDLVNLDTSGTNGVANVVGSPNQGYNTIAGKNVSTIALEVPASCLTSGGSTIIGAWTTASMRQARVINPTATYSEPAREGGPWVQVSRLGMPLVNEVVIGLKDKDRFNGSEPKDDGQFADYVTNPTLPEVLELLFGGAGVRAPNLFPRVDLVTAFLTGVPSVNANGSTAEMLRLNTGVGATAAASQSPFGAALCFDASTATANATLNLSHAGCDPSGFPNGRRPGDDVVDIALRVAMGYLVNTTDAPSSHLPLVDGAGVSSADFDAAFPYLKTPTPGAP
jgi:hypothetical protein